MTQHDNTISTELVFGLVGAVGTDLDLVSAQIKVALREFDYSAEEVRLSALFKTLDWEQDLPDSPLDRHISTHMDAGNRLRRTWLRGDAAALFGITAIADIRADKNEDDDGTRPLPRFAYILRSLKHPEEVELLRSVYGSRFYLVSAYAPRTLREGVLRAACVVDYGSENPSDWGHPPGELIQRDEAEAEPPDLPEEQRGMGQNVRETFHRGDFFLDARDEPRLKRDTKRMVEIVFGHPFRTPTRDEYALFQAEGSGRRSAEPGRQVGAAIAGKQGTVIALGSNEVPRAGGGTYWESQDSDEPDAREFHNEIDTNERMKHEIAGEIVSELENEGWLKDEMQDAPKVLAAIERTRLGNIIEFGRAVHAEMDALLDAARRGVSVQDGTLYCTTFPCHNCARHIVAAGIGRVVYVAPYAKSLAKALHEDSIEVAKNEPRKDAVHFEPFVGVAPRRYLEFFEAGKRKEEDGRIIVFVPSDAMPRISEYEPSDLRPQEERYTQREQLGLDLLTEIWEGTGLGPTDGKDDTND